ncbi:hypothetical protein M413DRAFT_217938 [Hebeloma cylindrosporum]|uniref:Uncharacterized protein n=1 Tax=Hebeloma cylindrosporum TaxID=76867 RepID=A0A0C2Z436_HEBCY|nr:hypothetical protein M413DRAFT_217938 [Hebeloma cylindrosporum h7]
MAKGRKNKRARTPEEEVFHVEVVKKARVVPAKDEDTDDEMDGNKKRKKEKQKNTQSTHAPAKWEYFVKVSISKSCVEIFELKIPLT